MHAAQRDRDSAVSKRSALVISVLGVAVLLQASAAAAALKAFVYPHTGEIRLINPDIAPFPIVLYEILYDDVVPALLATSSAGCGLPTEFMAPLREKAGGAIDEILTRYVGE